MAVVWWWPMSPWLSPGAAWFIFFNVVVGAIAVMSREQGGHGPATRRKLARTASTVVMESLRSISIFSFHSGGDYSVVSPRTSHLHHVQDQYYTFQEQEAQEVSSVAPELCKPEPPLVAGESGAAATTSPTNAPVATVSAADAAAPASENEEEETEDDGESMSLDEAYALARARRQSPAAAATAADTAARVPRKREPVKVAEIKGRAHACGRGPEEVDGKAEVNARAEQFIQQFRQELKLERLNSILKYTHALRRGSTTITGIARGSSDRLV